MSSPTSSPAAGRTVADGVVSVTVGSDRTGGLDCAGWAERPRRAPVTIPNRLRDGAGAAGSTALRGGSENNPARGEAGLAFGSWCGRACADGAWAPEVWTPWAAEAWAPASTA